MENSSILALAAAEGFTAALVNTRDIVFDPSFRPYCEENLCGQYGANYSCPPDCGTPEQMKQRVQAHGRALVLRTQWNIPDYRDVAAIVKAKAAHNEAELRLAAKMHQSGFPGFTVGASGCALCSPCARLTGEPCRFPDKRYSCMSAYCIYVKDLAEKCGMDYAWNEGQLSFYGLYVFD